MKSVTPPAGYTIADNRFGFEDDHSTKGLRLVFGAGIVLVILAVALVFDSVWAVGVILVVGLAVHQAILLVDAALEKRRNSGRRLTAEDVLQAASDRAGMIMLVTLTTLASLIPLAVGTDADSLFGSIALATTGGTVAGTLGALFIVPALLVSRPQRAPAPAP